MLTRRRLQLSGVERQRCGHPVAEERTEQACPQRLRARGQQSHREGRVAEEDGPQVKVDRLGRRLLEPIGVEAGHPPFE